MVLDPALNLSIIHYFLENAAIDKFVLLKGGFLKIWQGQMEEEVWDSLALCLELNIC